jgi:hypothetical protein
MRSSAGDERSVALNSHILKQPRRSPALATERGGGNLASSYAPKNTCNIVHIMAFCS